MQSLTISNTPRICIAFYKSLDFMVASTHKIWLSLDNSQTLLQRLLIHLKSFPTQYWVVHDSEGFLGFDVPEVSNLDHLDRVSQLAEASIAKDTRLMTKLIDELNQQI
jgi:hypothetical protein